MMPGLKTADSPLAPFDMRQPAARPQPHGITMRLQWRLALTEWLLVLIVAACAWLFAPRPPPALFWLPILASIVVFGVQALGGYGLDRLLRPRRAVLAGLVGGGLLLAGLVGLHWGLAAPPVVVLGGLACLALGAFLAASSLRWCYAAWIAQQTIDGRLARQVGIIACGAQTMDMALIGGRLRAETSLPPRLHGFTFAKSAKVASMSRLHDLPALLQRVDALSAQLGEAGLDEVVLVVEGARRLEDICRDVELTELLKALETLPHRTRLLLPEAGGGMRFVRLLNPPLDHGGLLLKRAMDLSVAALLLILLAPLLLAVAAAIKLESKGPVFFRQKRYGYRNMIFDLWKFRSMYVELCDADAAKLTARDDPRVTHVGAFIRRTSIDELPQLFNVLKGDMSLVGPRPHPMAAKAGERFYEDVVDRFGRRYRVRPGLTGLAQVSGLRGNTDTEDKLLRRFEADLDYVRNWSIGRDLWILCKTPWVSLTGENAY